MKRFPKNGTAWKLFLIRKKYQEKRHRYEWKRRKKLKKSKGVFNVESYNIEKHKKAPYINLEAPKNFSFIENTDMVLEYFENAKQTFHNKKNVKFDISEVFQLTPDAITLLIASIKNPEFTGAGTASGNEPKKDDLKRIFSESGFYEHVTSRNGFGGQNSKNLLHKEVDQKVVPTIAENACLTGINHVFGNSHIFSPLYEILIECMSNTHNHATLNEQGKCKWWLYVYNDPQSKTAKYSFVDLGVGIFESRQVNYLKKILKHGGLFKNIDLVDDLLNGKIRSRIKKDRTIRGKGIPQIFRHSKHKYFKSFYIIANDVKIDLIRNKKEELKYNFSGTFLYWELAK